MEHLFFGRETACHLGLAAVDVQDQTDNMNTFDPNPTKDRKLKVAGRISLVQIFTAEICYLIFFMLSRFKVIDLRGQ